MIKTWQNNGRRKIMILCATLIYRFRSHRWAKLEMDENVHWKTGSKGSKGFWTEEEIIHFWAMHFWAIFLSSAKKMAAGTFTHKKVLLGSENFNNTHKNIELSSAIFNLAYKMSLAQGQYIAKIVLRLSLYFMIFMVFTWFCGKLYSCHLFC